MEIHAIGDGQSSPVFSTPQYLGDEGALKVCSTEPCLVEDTVSGPGKKHRIVLAGLQVGLNCVVGSHIHGRWFQEFLRDRKR